MMLSKRRALSVLISLFFATTGASAVAETFPDKPLRLVVGFAAGGSTDIVARILAPKMEAILGQQVIVENRTGASGAIAAEAVRKAAPDGYTLLLCTTGLFSIQPFLPQPSAFDASQLTPVSLIAKTPYVVLVNDKVPVKTLDELIAYAKARPGELNFASSGNGTASHIAGEMFVQRTDTEIPHIPYKGAGQAMTDLVAGRVSIMFDQLASAMPQIKAQGIRPIAIAGTDRLASLPNVASTQELGLDNFDPTPWAGLCTSPGVPQDRLDTIQKAVKQALADPELRQRFDSDGLPIVGSTPDEFKSFLKKDAETWSATIKNIVFK